MFIHLENHVVILSRSRTLTWVQEAEIKWLERETKYFKKQKYHKLSNALLSN